MNFIDNLLRSKLEEIKAATGPTWQAKCIEKVQRVTRLTLQSDASSYDVGYPCWEGHPAELSWPSRHFFNKTTSAEDWCTLFPKPRQLKPQPEQCTRGRVIDPLGSYHMADQVMGARVELYWGRILAEHLKNPTWPLKALAKVVMLHELAHYVTHEGRCFDSPVESCSKCKCIWTQRSHWSDFENAGAFIIEVVAQMAAEDSLVAMGSAETKTLNVFQELRKGQPPQYQANEAIRNALAKDILQQRDLRKGIGCSSISCRLSMAAEMWQSGSDVFWAPIPAGKIYEEIKHKPTNAADFIEQWNDVLKSNALNRINVRKTGDDWNPAGLL